MLGDVDQLGPGAQEGGDGVGVAVVVLDRECTARPHSATARSTTAAMTARPSGPAKTAIAGSPVRTSGGTAVASGT